MTSLQRDQAGVSHVRAARAARRGYNREVQRSQTMINVSTTAADEDQRAAHRRGQGRQRSARVRAGRRLLGFPVRADDRGKRRRRATRCSSRTASSCSSTRSASATSRAPRSTSSTRSPAAASRSRTRTRPRRAAAVRRSAWTARAAAVTITKEGVPTRPRISVANALPDLSRLKPDGGKRSSKREQIVNVFLRQEGHLSADDLVRPHPQATTIASAAPPSTARCSGWWTPASPARSISAKAASGSSTRTGSRATSI